MILLDTCVLFWLECDPGRISKRVAEALRRPDAVLHASAISAFELGLKVRDKLVGLPLPPGEWVGEVCRRRGIRVAVLKERSPSCGSAWIHDGTFSGRLDPGQGVAAAALRAGGIYVFSEAGW